MDKINNIAVISAGSLGVMFGDILNQCYGKERVYFVADWKRVEKYRDKGIFLNTKRCDFTYYMPDEIIVPPDLILIAVKYPALQEAIHIAKQISGPHTIFISLLNGIASEQDLLKHFAKAQVLYCVAQEMRSEEHTSELQSHS